MNDLPPTPQDVAMTKKHTVSSVNYNLEPHALDHLQGMNKALDRLGKYDKPKATALAKKAVKKLLPAIQETKKHAGVADKMAQAKKALSAL